MSISPARAICVNSAKIMHQTGASLASTLYSTDVTILLSGELGAGKTTFLQGFAKSLGIEAPVTSPTFALEQHYKTKNGIPFIHLDLYRLDPAQAASILLASEEMHSIRCIEWAERLPSSVSFSNSIQLHFYEQLPGRRIEATFKDMHLPSVEDVSAWRSLVHLPKLIQQHCNKVADVAVLMAESLLAAGTIVRLEALYMSALLHDLLRFIDFKSAQGTPKEEQVWSTWRERFAGLKHEAAIARFLEQKGYPELARIIEVHGVRLPPNEEATTEQKLLFYADKRVAHDKIVSLRERFEDFQRRHGGSGDFESQVWYQESLRIEKELFPHGINLDHV